MLTVKTPEEVFSIIDEVFKPCTGAEKIPLSSALGRVLFKGVESGEFVPDFDRSTVDGYALAARDTFGCSESIPALLELCGSVDMGGGGGEKLQPGCCRYVPTGGAIPPGADAVVMLEYAENYGDGSIGIVKSAAPGMNMIFRGDDVHPGKLLLPAGRRLSSRDIGALAALGAAELEVCQKPLVGIISTGDELVPIEEKPGEGQVRDVNSPMLCALAWEFGADTECWGIVPDEPAALAEAISRAIARCDMVLVSGGSSAGEKDMTVEIISQFGELLFHGIAMKPGKPTILGNAGGKPVFGLPGHPAAAYFAARLFVRRALARLMGREPADYTLPAVLTESVSANHGRAQYNAARLFRDGKVWYASPVMGKSGLISTLAGSQGYFCIPRDREGFAAGETVDISLYSLD